MGYTIVRLFYRYLSLEENLLVVHSCDIIHGDMYCVRWRQVSTFSSLTVIQNNVLIDADRTARLADFGFTSLVGDIPDALNYLERSTMRPGALRWAAPEQILPEEGFKLTTRSDIYSFGCISLQESFLV